MFNTRPKKLVWALLAVFLVIVSLSFYEYVTMKVFQPNAKQFDQALLTAVDQGDTFNMSELVALEWDTLYVFPPYTSKQQMEELVGTSWTTSSYLGYYVVDKSSLGQHPLDDESFNNLVLVQKGNVVLDRTFTRREVDLTHLPSRISRDDARFEVQDRVLKQADIES
ncbi:hypothetical protein JJQ72_01520 [Paenibacillus sp. F411]|uniref:hypothetical protein n=1 Tax=Paenibacillus sp. F411 TaxID=2820239 RepID=UPI001AAED363|nr:hypothetical protein [Paenibacillus sp. F411]MBO2942663.1 hypothetical protein [Paenibacillus sp. F411]